MSSEFIAINWGSTNFRAQLISRDSRIADQLFLPAGVTKISRGDIIQTLKSVVMKWPSATKIYASGMIGSSDGWEFVDYGGCPANLARLAAAMTHKFIGDIKCHIVPGLCCRHMNNDTDIMRGEEIEIFGLLKHRPQLADGLQIAAFPGTHTKWVRIKDGEVINFYTSMTGELFDNLSSYGLLSSVLNGEATAGAMFCSGVNDGLQISTGFGRALFGIRAKTIMGDLTPSKAPSYLRGLLIGAEIADAIVLCPELLSQKELTLVGNRALSSLYVMALKNMSITGYHVDANFTNAHGFSALHECLQREAAA